MILNKLTRLLVMVCSIAQASPTQTILKDALNQKESPCVDVLQHLSNYFLTDSDTLMHIIRNSGHDYNDFGRYRDCHETH